MSSSSSSLGSGCRIAQPSLTSPALLHPLSNEDVYRLHARIGELTMENEALRRQIEQTRSGEAPHQLLGSTLPSPAIAGQARLLLSLAESVRSGVPPVAKAGELGEAIAALWGAIKGRIRYRAAAPPATALSPLPESSMGRTRSRKPLQTVVEGSERVEEAENTLRSDDLSEDIVRLKDIREGLGNILDGTREQIQSRAGAAVKPPATSLSSPISKSRLHPRRSSYHPPPATPASSARKR
ncbi:hypothetical protein FOZ63_002455 [Perkinsus olseni]|uniref:Uncharacterized protein n=1 Tax=Perkinsus olseni TaxID=32597 RepID=A0A7J6T5N7_PEROL|nr:hypothetical protein FOZ63_002455 [Perkinsus olseni]